MDSKDDGLGTKLMWLNTGTNTLTHCGVDVLHHLVVLLLLLSSPDFLQPCHQLRVL